MRLKREDYLKQIRPFYEVDLIKVITGVRRGGKSVLLEEIRDEIRAYGVPDDHIIYINLEDMDYAHILNATDLHKEIKARIRADGKYYIFLDEIQHVESFEKAISSFRATLNCSLFVTGSNSTLLSGELATLLTGRTVEFEVLPFSFCEMKEYLELNGRPFDEEMIYDYLEWGGLPVRFSLETEADKRRYIENLYTGIVNKDIVSDKQKVERSTFMAISQYILANAGMEFSAANVANYYRTNNPHSEISERTVSAYLEKMKNAFLIHSVPRFNIAGKSVLKSREKYYATDTGFRTINTNPTNFYDTFFLENLVYNELLFQGFRVYVGKTYKGEVDFVAMKDGKKCFIQVAYLLSDNDVIAREFGAFSPITDSSPKVVISLDKIDLSRGGIAHLNLTDFLLQKRELPLT